MIAITRIRRIYYGEFYRDERSPKVAAEIGIELIPRISEDSRAEQSITGERS